MSSISGVSGSSNAWAAVSAQRAQHQAKMFAKVDTDSSGGVDQTELSSMLSDVASKTGASLGDSQELFTKMDSNADGSGQWLALDIADQGYVLVQGSNRFTDTGKALMADPEVRRSFLGG